MLAIYNAGKFVSFVKMEKIGHIEIRVSGKKGKLDLKPDTLDVRELIDVLEYSEDLLFPGDKKGRPLMSYEMEEGSVRHILKTSIQTIIGFNAIIAQVDASRSIDFLEINTAKALESFQETAYKKDFSFLITTSIMDSATLTIDKSTHYMRSETVWLDAEFYFYGKITNAGGKDKANIHVLTDEYGTIRIDTPQRVLQSLEDNILYKPFGVRAMGRQQAETGELDKSSLRFVELVDYHPKYDESYLKGLRNKAAWLNEIEPESWLREVRYH